ncbi:RNA polymerase sigma-70 factor, ECF subfamily [Lachnospiraceae bacterium KM106-2]|nr:RNA polymerase sigma-70 factor, ECF subfamily [Lachnospiraceae bacterium KM106-2]
MTKQEFEKIYQDNFSVVYRYLLKICQDQHLAEELTSVTFFKAINNIDKFEGKCTITSWLCQIAKYSYYSYLRKNKRLVELNSIIEQMDTNSDMEEQLIDSMTSKEIHKVVDGLEEPYKKVFHLRIFQELSFKQIASIFGKTENWACVTYHRARNKVRERMEEKK